MKYFLISIARQGEFYGRTSRKGYWVFTLIYSLLYTLVLFLSSYYSKIYNNPQIENLIFVFVILFFLPAFSSAWRRIQDSGNPGFICFIPFVNLYLLLKKGNESENEYGKNPAEDEVW